VVRPDGRSQEVGIAAALAEAHLLAALSDPSPLVAAGTHRLLVAVLQALYAPQSLDDLASLLRAGYVDPARLEAFAAEHAARFDLFDPEAPFLQTGDVPLDGWRKPEKGQKHPWADPKPVAALFAEVPAETNRAHFHHVTDESHRVCPACCARGLVTIPAFASSGGAGIRPSINGVPPVYVLPAGASLFESLALSLTAPDYQPRVADPQHAAVAIWNGPPVVAKNQPVGAVGYLESLTFPARRMRLYPRPDPAACTHCGQRSPVTVSTMLFEMGHWLSEGSGTWDDPFVAFRPPQKRPGREDAGLRPVRPEEGKALWREYASLLLSQEQNLELRPAVVRQSVALINRGVLDPDRELRFRCVGLRTDGKAKIFEWLDEALDAPPTLLTDVDRAYHVEQALGQARDAEYILSSSFDRHFRPERTLGERVDQRVVRFKTLRARMLAMFWSRLAEPFRQFVVDLAETDESALQAWSSGLVRVGHQTFDETAAQAGDRADALRARVEAQDECAGRLWAKHKEWNQ
jgi:CRISPR system Cascade subunit CasA